MRRRNVLEPAFAPTERFQREDVGNGRCLSEVAPFVVGPRHRTPLSVGGAASYGVRDACRRLTSRRHSRTQRRRDRRHPSASFLCLRLAAWISALRGKSTIRTYARVFVLRVYMLLLHVCWVCVRGRRDTQCGCVCIRFLYERVSHFCHFIRSLFLHFVPSLFLATYLSVYLSFTVYRISYHWLALFYILFLFPLHTLHGHTWTIFNVKAAQESLLKWNEWDYEECEIE